MDIQGEKVVVNKSDEAIFTHFTELQNFKDIMPENIQKFEVNGESFVFGLPGMPEIRLILKETTPHSNITLGSASSKMPFTLSADIDKLNEDSSEVQLTFNGEFNAMMAMMIKKPLTKFIDTLTENLGKM
jgi:carbon monoxide dehydrogenase subunit G